MAGTLLLLAVCVAGSMGDVQAWAAKTQAASTITDVFLAKNGQAEAVIVVGSESGPFYQWVAEEIQRYLKRLTVAEFPIVTSDEVPAEKTLLVLGGPQVNPLSATAQQHQLVNFSGLKPEGFVLKAIELEGRQALVAGGNDETATMYAAYELLERLGIVFQLTNDIIPERKSDLALPALDVRMEPVLKYRGMHCCHGLRWYMGLEDFRKHIDQMAKLKLNTLNFYWGMGAPWLEFSYDGKVGEIFRTKESHYLAWGGSWHTSSGSKKDIRIGRTCFPDEYLGPPEFAEVQTEDEAYRIARDFLREVIRYAHLRKVQVRLTLGEIPYVPPNLVPERTKRVEGFVFQTRYHGAVMPIGDPAVLDIWEAAMLSMIETYPDADSYGVWAPEHSTPVDDVQRQQMLSEYAAARKLIPTVEAINRQGNAMSHSELGLDNDFAQICVAAEIVERIKKHHPNSKLGVVTLFRGYLLRAMDALLPKDVWLMNMENCANHGSMMDFYDGITGRELIVMPRVDEDGCELHIQLNAMMYDRDEIITGAAKYGLAGFIGQLNKERGLECNVRYLAEGAWNPDIQCQSFYEGYLKRLYGPDALDSMLKAYLLLEENDKALVWWGRQEIFIGFGPFSTCNLRTNVNYKEVELNLDRQQLQQDIKATMGESKSWSARAGLAEQHPHLASMRPGEYWDDRAAQCREALELLRRARPKVLPGSREELEYVIFKTENFIKYFEVLRACHDAKVALDRAWLAKIDADTPAFWKQLEQCRAAVDRADRLARAQAGQMIAYADDKTEQHILHIYNKYVISSTERSLEKVDEIIAFHRGQGQLKPITSKQKPASKKVLAPHER